MGIDRRVTGSQVCHRQRLQPARLQTELTPHMSLIQTCCSCDRREQIGVIEEKARNREHFAKPDARSR
jgi:hypothetical protein